MVAVQDGNARIVLTDVDLKLNFKATFSEEVAKFTIDVDDEFLRTTKLKASLTRLPMDLEQQPEQADGPPRRVGEKVARYWADEYDWQQVEGDLNRRFEQFTTIVRTGTSSSEFPAAEPVPLHFVHHRSPRADALPLLFMHGWPGSFLEVEHILEPLVRPERDDLPAFHVVAPSIPGYGFSPSPRRPGMGYRATAAAFHALMQKLGYERFVWQGGDAGDFIGRFLSIDFPAAVVAGHSNFWMVPPTAEDLQRQAACQTSADEDFVLAQQRQFVEGHWSYGQVHQTRPLTLAAGLTDSPVGLALWIYDICAACTDDAEAVFVPERLVTWTMMHWINGPYGAFSLYKNGRKDGVISLQGIGSMPYVTQPVALSQFPRDIWYRTPLAWAKRAGNVVALARHDRGGHFAALDAPDLLVDDVRAFFGDGARSGTSVFRTPA